MGIADWLFGGGDDRAAMHSDLENRASKPHNQWHIFFQAAQAQTRAERGEKKYTKKEAKEHAKRASSWWGSNSGSHEPKKNGWWD